MGSNYEDITDQFIRDMADLQGYSIEEYIEGLQYALGEIEVSIQAAKEDL